MQRSATSRVRAAASRGSRSAVSAGERSTDSWLPRRSRSQPSSEVRLRIATSASWSAARRAMVGVDVAGRDGRHAERGGELLERGVAAGVAALVRALQLDVERARKGLREPRGARSGR